MRLFVACWIIFLSLGATYEKQGKQGDGSIFISKEEPKKIEPSPSFQWDFGKVQEGQVLAHTFVFKNESKKILNIKGVNTSCGCTVSEVENREVNPGESTIIKVKFNSKGYSGVTRQFIYAHTDSVENPVVRFIIKADVEK